MQAMNMTGLCINKCAASYSQVNVSGIMWLNIVEKQSTHKKIGEHHDVRCAHEIRYHCMPPDEHACILS